MCTLNKQTPYHTDMGVFFGQYFFTSHVVRSAINMGTVITGEIIGLLAGSFRAV